MVVVVVICDVAEDRLLGLLLPLMLAMLFRRMLLLVPADAWDSNRPLILP